MPQVILGGLLVGGATIATGTLAAGLATVVGQFGAGLVLSGIASELAPKPTGLVRTRGRTVTTREPVSPREIVYGRTRKGGTIVFMHATGDKNEYLHIVVAIAGHQVESIGAVYFDGEMAAASDGTPEAAYTDHLLIEKKLGTSDQTAFTQLMADASDKWTSNHRLRGIACAHIRLKFDAEVFPRGVPNITFDVEGKNDIYDPRTGQTGYTTNSALCLADYMSLSRYGIGAAIGAEDGINTAALIEAANICDESVGIVGAANEELQDTDGTTLLDTGGSPLLNTTYSATELRYTTNGVVSLSSTPKSIIEAMLTAMAGKAVWQGTDWKIRAGAYRTPTVILTEKDVREAGLSLDTRVTRPENFNGVRGQFVSPANDWQPDDAPAYQSSVYLTEDGGEERWKDVTLPFTISASTAQRLFKIELERRRRQQTVAFHGKLSAYRAASGEAVMLDRDRWGWLNKPFDVEQVELGFDGAALTTTLALRETSPLIYSWEASEEKIYNAAPSTNLPSASDIAAPGVPQLTEDLYQTRSGVKALIRVAWGESPSAFVYEYTVQARRVLDETGAATGDDWLTRARTDQLFAEILDVQPGTWEVRVKAINFAGVSSDYVETSQAILGLAAPPQQLTNLTLQKVGGAALLKWDKSPDLDVVIGGKVVIRHSNSTVPSWSNSVSIDLVDGASTTAAVPLKEGTYLIRALDASGLYGPVSTKSTKGIQAVPFVSAATPLTPHPTWSGTKTNVEIDGTSIKLTNLALDGTYEFSSGFDFGVVKAVRVRADIDVSAINLGVNVSDWPNISGLLSISGSEGAEIDVVVEMRTTDDDPAGSPTWSDWSRLVSTEDEFRGAEFRAILSTEDTNYNVLLSALTITADEVV